MSGNPQKEINNSIDTIEEAIEDIRAGKLVIVVDDEDRENEGDFVAAAECITPELINFMAKHGRGLICAPIVAERAKELDLDLMVSNNTDPHHTQFTVSVDKIGDGCTTGISASDRAKTVKAIIDPNTKPEQLARPGHIFPLIAKKGGVLRRTGHTEAAIDLARLAGFEPAGVIVEIMNEDGTMSRLPELLKLKEKLGLKLITIEDLVAYRMQQESLIQLNEEFEIETEHGLFTLKAFEQTTNDQVHIALVKGTWDNLEPVLVRMHSAGIGNDIFHLLTTDGPTQLNKAMKALDHAGKGVIVYMNQQQINLTLLERLRNYKLKKTGEHVPSFSKDNRDFGIGAQILHELGVKRVKLLTNHSIKRVGIEGYGLTIVENVSLNGKF